MQSLFVIGDSISMQYGPHLKQIVEGRFRYDRKGGEQEAIVDLDRPEGANGGDSSMVLSYLNDLRAAGASFDLLLLNCGLHDIKIDKATEAVQVAEEPYRSNLKEIAALASGMAREVVWIRTTDAVDHVHNESPISSSLSFRRFHADVVRYNEIADEVFREHRIPCLDLYRFTRVFGHSAYSDHVHFTDEISRLQAAYIAGYLESRR